VTGSLGRNKYGKLVVCHQPNRASGGVNSEIAVDLFLSQGGQGPEYQALSKALTVLELSGEYPGESKSDAGIIDVIDRALGQAVARCLSKLASEAQTMLFEAAVQAEGKATREALARHLHDKHERTIHTVQAEAISQADKIG
jgi:hypothetical protein